MREPRRLTRALICLASVTALVTATPASAGPTGGALPPELVQILLVAGRYGIPGDAEMVAANVTAVGAEDPGFLTVFPCDEPAPTTSNVNYQTDQVVPNLVFSRIAPNGTICIATRAVVDVLVDVVGYVPAGSALTPLPTPVRAVDTRGPAGSGPGRPAGSVLEIPITGQYGVAPDADLVVFNATAIAGGSPGYLTAFPCGALPDTSSVNYQPGQIVPNLATSRLSAVGTLCIFTLAPADVIVDIAAYATDGIEPLAAPVRIVDTRSSGSPTANGVVTVDVAGRPDVPDDASAAVYNLTGVGAEGPGFATSYPCDEPIPLASNLNYGVGAVVANGSVTKLASNGTFCIYTLAATDLIVDLVGYTVGASHYVPIAPVRALDTREGWQRRCDWVLTRKYGGFSGTGRLPTTIEAYHLVTGSRVSVPLPVEIDLPLVGPTLTRECDGFWLYTGRTFGPTVAGLWRFGFDGSRSLHPAPPFTLETAIDIPPAGTRVSLTALDDGSVVAIDDTRMFDLTTWQIRPTPMAPSIQDGSNVANLQRLFVSADGSTLAGVYRNVITSTPTLVVRRSTGELVSTIPLTRTTSDSVALSPDGTYLVLVDSDAAANEQVIVVMTRFGEVVDAARGDVRNITTEFMGDGAIVLCIENIGVFTWDLFGAFVLALRDTDLLPDRRGSCVGFSA